MENIIAKINPTKINAIQSVKTTNFNAVIRNFVFSCKYTFMLTLICYKLLLRTTLKNKFLGNGSVTETQTVQMVQMKLIVATPAPIMALNAIMVCA